MAYALWLPAQAAFMFAVCFLCQLLRPLGFWYYVLAYASAPLGSLFSAEFIVMRGVNPYLAWLLPPVMWALAGYALTLGYAPEAGVMLACAFAALVGAAAGDVRSRARKTKKRG